jgi:hypothetical protein
MSKQDNSNAQVRPEELTIVGGPLADYEMYAKIPEPIEVSVSTPWGPMQYNMFYHNGDLILEFQGAVEKKQPTETELVVAEQPEEHKFSDDKDIIDSAINDRIKEGYDPKPDELKAKLFKNAKPKAKPGRPRKK